MVKHLPAMWETQVQFLGQEDPLEGEIATHSNIIVASLVAENNKKPLYLLLRAGIPQKKWSSHHGQQKSLKCSTWMQSQKQQNDLYLFPRQTIQYHGNPSLCSDQ